MRYSSPSYLFLSDYSLNVLVFSSIAFIYRWLGYLMVKSVTGVKYATFFVLRCHKSAVLGSIEVIKLKSRKHMLKKVIMLYCLTWF